MTSLAMHRLIQQALLRHMNASQYQLVLDTVVTLLSQAFPRQTFGMAMDCFGKTADYSFPMLLRLHITTNA